jgi:hypothetical protein
VRALSIRSPYAEQIVAGAKGIENRSWRPPAGIGRIAVHRCGKGGMIIGTVEVVEVVDQAEAMRRYPDQAPYITGPWCWVLANPTPCAPIPISGRLGLWQVLGEIEMVLKPCPVCHGDWRGPAMAGGVFFDTLLCPMCGRGRSPLSNP